MKKALIIGITGGFGGHVARALARKGFSLRALMRDPTKLPDRYKGTEVIVGDAANIEDVRRAAEGVELIVYAVNPPKYHWQGVVLPLLENTAQVAEEKKLTVVFPGNVYVFDPKDGPLFDESTPHRPVSSKGKMRQDMEARLKVASKNGARIIVIRMGDFIGENLASDWFQHLIKPTKNGYKLAAVGDQGLIHTWAYLPDVGNTIVALLEKSAEFDAYSVFHFKGHQLSFNDIAHAIEQVSDKQVTIGSFPWMLLRLMSPFSKMFKGLIEMRYLWNEVILLDETKLANTLAAAVPHTELTQVLIDSGTVQREMHIGRAVRF